MEISCTRCHQPVEAGACYCAACGMPQLVYLTEGAGDQALAERGDAPVRDAASVDWKLAMPLALILAIPAGILSSVLSPVSILLMGGAGAWVVAIYLRRERPAWITIGAGARIGLVTGLVGGWTAAAASGVCLFTMRFFLGQGSSLDTLLQNIVDQQLNQHSATGIDAHAVEIIRNWLLSPVGRAEWVVGSVVVLTGLLMLFAVAGGALSARLLGRPSRPQF
jgi:hypothetical protein